MTAWVLAACVLAADTPDAARAVEQVFRAKPELAEIHRGYLAYLDAHPALAEAEARVNALRLEDAFARAVSAFEEWLLGERGAFARYVVFLEGVSRNGDLPDALGVIENFRAGMRGLRATSPYGLELNAEAALSFLRDPQNLTAIPPEFVPYVARLQRDAALRDRLMRALESVDRATAHTPEIAAWWLGFVSMGTVPEAVSEFDGYLRAQEDVGGLWRERIAAFDGDENALAWVTYWHGRVRREPRLARDYYTYLEWLRRQGDRADAMADVGASWPPERKPPALELLEDGAGARPTLRKPKAPAIEAPRVPSVRMPKRPVVPVTPQVRRPVPRTGR